jgi:small-conductance mechanosensitive channel
MTEDFFKQEYLQAFVIEVRQWFMQRVLALDTLAQVLIIAVSFALAWYLAPRVRPWLSAKIERFEVRLLSKRAVLAVTVLFLPIISLIILWASVLLMAAADWPHDVIDVVVSLLTAWVIVRLSSQIILDPSWARFVAVFAWTLVALHILGLLTPILALLDSIAITLGTLRVSAQGLIKGSLFLIVLVWVAIAVSRMLDARLSSSTTLTPVVQALFSKLLKIGLITVAVLMAVTTMGIDLTVLAVFGGALGVGIGLGMQRVVANLFSGVLLLLDRSIKPGDIIAIGDSFGWVNFLGARYVSVVTRDGVEHLIPNEELVTQRVENWSHSNRLVRLKIPLGVHYKSDLPQAIALCVEAAQENERVLRNPDAKCLLNGFGDSSVDLEIRIWINDPQNGVSNLKSDVLLRVWHKFHEHGVEIPYPQRDLHLRTGFQGNDESVLPELRPSGELPER